MLSIGISPILTAQNYDYIWLFGYGSNSENMNYGGSVLDFNEIPPLIYYQFQEMDLDVTNSSICNSAGLLQFYTNGNYVANAEHGMMENGGGLSPGPFHTSSGFIMEQGCLALPNPGDSSQYFLFHLPKNLAQEDLAFHSSKLFYSLIDMAENDGLGAVLEKNEVLIEDKLHSGKLTAVKHANGEDWWVLARRYNSNEYYTLLLTAEGIELNALQAVGDTIPFPGVGQAVFSPDGSKYVAYNAVSLEKGNFLDIYDFDRCTGVLSNPIQYNLQDSAWAGGAAISANSRFLYVSSYNYIYQYDLWADDIGSTKDTVAVYDGFLEEPVFRTRFFMAQLAPDGKIYLNSTNSTHYLHVINQPDLPGESCDVCQHCVELPTWNAFSLPNFPNYRLGATVEPCDSIVDVIEGVTVAEHLYVYPNPASDFLKFQLENPAVEYLQLELYSARGQKIQTVQIAKGDKLKTVEVKNWPGGIYFYRLSDRQGRLLNSGKVVVR